MNDNIDMEASKESRKAEEPGPQDEPLKDAEEALKKKKTSPPSQPTAEKEEPSDESTAEDEEPGTFDKVYEHGRQMGF
jgi:hypothetical protein